MFCSSLRGFSVRKSWRDWESVTETLTWREWRDTVSLTSSTPLYSKHPWPLTLKVHYSAYINCFQWVTVYTQHHYYGYCKYVHVWKWSLSLSQTGISLPSKLSFAKVFSKFSLTTDPDPVELQERIQGLESYLQVSTSAVHACLHHVTCIRACCTCDCMHACTCSLIVLH